MRKLLSFVLAGGLVLLVTVGAWGDSGGGLSEETTGVTGGGASFTNVQPSLGLNYFVPLTGIYPSMDSGTALGVATLGNVRMFAGNFSPGSSVPADGRLLPVSSNTALFSLFGTTFGGDGETTFAVPDLTGRAVVHPGTGPGLSTWRQGEKRGSDNTVLTTANLPSHTHSLVPPPSEMTGPAGGGAAFPNIQASSALNYIISIDDNDSDDAAGGTFTGQVALFGGNFAPRGWAFANGNLLRISERSDLFSILGTTYGGDGRETFALPDLRGRVPVHPGTGAGLRNWRLGERRGAETVVLTEGTMPSHTHTLPTSLDPTGPAGGGGAFSTTQPSLGLNYLIALQGIYPSEDGGVSDETFLGEVVMFAGNFAPRGWAFAEGQLLLISENDALFSLLGTTYGGDGEVTFALPDLRGRAAVGATDFFSGLGRRSGVEDVTLAVSHLAPHSHSYLVPEPLSLGGLIVLVAAAGLPGRRGRRYF